MTVILYRFTNIDHKDYNSVQHFFEDLYKEELIRKLVSWLLSNLFCTGHRPGQNNTDHRSGQNRIKQTTDMDKITNCPQAKHSELCNVIKKARFAMKDDQKYLSKMLVWKVGIIILWLSILNPQPSNLNFEFLIINFQSSYLKFNLFTLSLHLQFLFPLHPSKVQPI